MKSKSFREHSELNSANTDIELLQIDLRVTGNQSIYLNVEEMADSDDGSISRVEIPVDSKKAIEAEFSVSSVFKMNVISPRRRGEQEGDFSKSGERNRTSSITSNETTEPIPKAPDGGWGWMVVFGAFLVSFLMTGLLKSFGVLYVEILKTFPDATPGQVAWIPGILNTLSLVLSPLANAFRSCYGSRRIVFIGGIVASTGMILSCFAPNVNILTLTSGGIAGLGATMALTPSIIIVGQYFERKRALANSLSLCGSGLGGLVLPLFLEWSLNEYTLQGTYLLLAGLLLNICVSAMLYTPLDVYWKARNRPNVGKDINKEISYVKPIALQSQVSVRFVEDSISSGTQNSDSKRSNEHSNEPWMIRLRNKLRIIRSKLVSAFCLDLLTNRVFMLIVISVMFMSMGSPHLLFFLPSHVEKEYGYTKYVAALLISITSAGDLSGRTFLGYLSDKKYFKRHQEYLAAILASGLATVCIAFTSFYPLMAFSCFIYGVGTGTWQCFVPVLLADCLGTEKLGGTLALSRMFQGLSNLLVPIVVGHILQLTEHYSSVFLWMASSMTIAGLVVVFLPGEMRRLQRDFTVTEQCSTSTD